MLNVIQKPSPNHWQGRDGQTPIGVVIHIAAGNLHSVDLTFQNPINQKSAHYCVSADGSEIHQYVQEADTAWANGTIHSPSWSLLKGCSVNPNSYTISIENEGFDLASAQPSQLATLSELVWEICNRWGIPKDRQHIVGHYQIDAIRRPSCPAVDKSILDKLVLLVQARG